MLLTVKYLGHEIGFNTTQPIQSKNAAFHRNLSPITKIELMRFIGSMNFHSKLIEELHVNMNPLYDFYMIIINFIRTMIWKHFSSKLKLLSQKMLHSHYPLQKIHSLLL